MSGGYFDYLQYPMEGVASGIEKLIADNDNTERDEFGNQIGRQYLPEIIERFQIAARVIKQAADMIHRIDWLVSDDDGEESFLRRWKEDGLDV